MVMAIQQLPVVVVQVHTAAQTVTEHLAAGALPLSGPFAVAERAEPIFPNLPEIIAIDIPLVEIAPDGGTSRYGSVDPYRCYGYSGGA